MRTTILQFKSLIAQYFCAFYQLFQVGHCYFVLLLCLPVVGTLLFLPTPLSAQVLLINDQQMKIPLGKSFLILEDPEGKLSFEELLKDSSNMEFKPQTAEVFNTNFSRSHFWVKLMIKNQTEQFLQRFLEIHFPLIDIVQFYIPDAKGQYRVIEAGESSNKFDHDVFRRFPVANISFLAGEQKSIYIHFRDNGGSIPFSATLWHPNALASFINQEQFGYGIYYGFMLMIILYTTFICISLRDPSYLFYLLYVISFTLWQIYYDGIAQQYLGNGADHWNNSSVISLVALHEIWLLLFTRSFLEIKRNLPKFDKLFLILIGFEIVVLILSLLMDLLMPRKIVIFMILIAAMSMLTLMVVSSTIIAFKGFRPAIFYVLAFYTLIIMAMIFSLKIANVLPSNIFTENCLRLGSAIEVCLLSIALADRFNRMRIEKSQALLAQLEESNKVAILSESFKRFVPHEFLNYLQKSSITEVRLGDNVQRKMTILFSDIRSFTTYSEKMTPQENFAFINDYLSYMGPIIRKHNGFIDKYIGDAIMALFDGKSADAVNAALEMVEALKQFNQNRKMPNNQVVQIGIGINTGLMMLGTIGDNVRMEGTVISDAVNLASRVENMTKLYGSTILITENTFYDLEDPSRFSTRVIDRVNVKGKNEAVTIFEVLDSEVDRIRKGKLESVKYYEEALGLLHMQEYRKAEALFIACLNMNPLDLAAEYHLRCCQQNIQFSDEFDSGDK